MTETLLSSDIISECCKRSASIGYTVAGNVPTFVCSYCRKPCEPVVMEVFRQDEGEKK